MEDIVKSAQALLDYIEENDVINKASLNEHDDHDQWAAAKFEVLIEILKGAIANPAPNAWWLIKKRFAKDNSHNNKTANSAQTVQ